VTRESRTVAYLFTTFPKTSETFLQREVRAVRKLGVDVRLFSFWGGGGAFDGVPVASFNKWRLATLLWIIPWAAVRYPRVFWTLVRGVLTRRPGSPLTLLENLLGAGFAGVHYREFRRAGYGWIHAVWGGAPATAAWTLCRLNGHPYSVGVHAYDLYEHGGDPWLAEKIAAARFVHTSTQMAATTLRERGLGAGKVHVIRRGLDSLPALRALRTPRRPLRIVCVARLVEKKGLPDQMALYRRLRDRGFPFEARILGDGPLRDRLSAQVESSALQPQVQLLGQVPHEQVWSALEWADVLVHTGVVAASGDRDGLPNVIPEAMSAGVVVVTTPQPGPREAIADGETGLVVALADGEGWEAALCRIAEDDALAERLRSGARAWVETHFDAQRNAASLVALYFDSARREA
jgi:glycosyltransferase involved in cell wall biosynthesis